MPIKYTNTICYSKHSDNKVTANTVNGTHEFKCDCGEEWASLNFDDSQCPKCYRYDEVVPECITKHLRYDTYGASEHAMKAIRELGITYQHATAQSMGDQWWFWNCENIPSILPDRISKMQNDPMDCIGFGLDKETAEAIRDYVKPLL